MFAPPIDLDTVRRLAGQHAKIAAIKDSSGDLPFMKSMIDAIRPERPDFSFMTGWDACLLDMLEIGCDGGTNASSGVVPELTRKIFDLAAEARIDEARLVQEKVAGLFDALFGAADFPEGFRMGVGLRGIEVGPGRTPRSAEDRSGDSETIDRLRDLLAAEGLA